MGMVPSSKSYRDGSILEEKGITPFFFDAPPSTHPGQSK
jgi:hypothetical protein